LLLAWDASIDAVVFFASLFKLCIISCVGFVYLFTSFVSST
jgi:hypothetical protein